MWYVRKIPKLLLPIDAVCSTSLESEITKECFITDFKKNDIGFDIGKQTLKLFKQHLNGSKTVIWNGPVGMFENDIYANGTKSLCEILKNNDGITILGGGDTASAAINFGYKNEFTHISTGGGASLELLEGKVLPGIDIISNK